MNYEEPNGNESINFIFSGLERIKQNLYEMQGQANKQESFLVVKQKEVEGWLSSITEKIEMANAQIDTFMKDYNERIKPAVNKKVNNAKKHWHKQDRYCYLSNQQYQKSKNIQNIIQHYIHAVINSMNSNNKLP